MQKTCCSLARSFANQESRMDRLDQSHRLRRRLSFRLRACADAKSLSDGMLVHDETIRAGQESDVYLSSLVVQMYGKCGALHDAHTWFGQMHDRSVFSWNCLIGANVRREYNMEAVQLLEQMQQECMIPNSATFANVVSACANKAALIQGMRLHARSGHSHLEAYVIVQTAFISMYNKCRKLNDARGVFDMILERDTVSWNAMLAAFVVQGDVKNAIQFFAQMQLEGVLWDKYTCVTMFSVCGNQASVKTGKQIHACIICSGLEMSTVVVLALVNMYGKSGNICNARAVFDTSPKQDIILWNAIITSYADSGDRGEAVHVFNRLFQEGVMPDKVTFLSILSELASQAALQQGRQMHARIMATSLRSDIQVETALVHMYGKLGSTNDASITFDSMLEHDIVSWNAMISVYVQHGQADVTFQHFERMQGESLMPNNVTITSVLFGCANFATLSMGKHIHAQAVSSGLVHDVFVGNALISMYCKCGSLEDAHRHFDSMALRDTITWNTLIAGSAQRGDAQAALQLFSQMCLQDMVPDQATYVSMLAAFANEVPPAVNYNKHNCASLFGRAVEADPAARTVSINAISSCEGLENAESLDSKVPMRKVALQTAPLVAIAQDGNAEEGIQPLVQNQLQGVMANKPIISNILGTHSNQVGKLLEGKMLHTHILYSGLDSDVIIGNALIKFYGRFGNIRDAQNIFERLSKWDVLSWNAMIAAYTQQGHDKEAIQMFGQMLWGKVTPDNVAFLTIVDACANTASLFHGSQMHMRIIYHGFDLDVILATALVNLYAKCGSLIEARWMFDHLPERDVVAWTSMIATYVQLGNGEEAIQLFGKMQREGVIPDIVAFTSALNACESQSALLEGKMVHTSITHYQLESDVNVATALVYMYGRCGSLNDARVTFYRISDQSLALWNAIIASYAQHGEGKEAFYLFYSMQQQGVTPDKITFVSILSACSRAGLVDEGYCCLLSVLQEHGRGPSVEHYDCMVDLLGRVGQLDEAEDLIDMMPFVPTVVSWATFLTACNNQVDVKRGETAMNHLVEMDPVDPATYVALSNIYAAAGGLDEPKEFCKEDKVTDCYEASNLQFIWEEVG